jgi:ATP-dependent RNA helicase DDX27
LENDDENQHQRTQVASIIAAARRNIQKSIQGKDTITQIQQQTGNTDEDEKDEPLDDQSSSDMDSSCSTSTCTSHQDVQDPASFHSMAQDSIRERYGNSDRKSREPDDHDANSQQIHDDDVDDEDMEESRKEALRKERERKEEAHKAADYFETTENTTNQTETGVILFSQLNLSRPLLRGVAAMGFVKPTPIQIKVIPIVLAGRDVCARYVVLGSSLLKSTMNHIFFQTNQPMEFQCGNWKW